MNKIHAFPNLTTDCALLNRWSES